MPALLWRDGERDCRSIRYPSTRAGYGDGVGPSSAAKPAHNEVNGRRSGARRSDGCGAEDHPHEPRLARRRQRNGRVEGAHCRSGDRGAAYAAIVHRNRADRRTNGEVTRRRCHRQREGGGLCNASARAGNGDRIRAGRDARAHCQGQC